MKEIALTRGFVTLVDDEDYEWLTQWKWHSNHGYAASSRRPPGGPFRRVFMHREILRMTDPEMLVDHVNGNTLDNRRVNLRPCNKSQNAWNSKVYVNNSSGFKGVRRDARRNKWYASIKVAGKAKFLGYFCSPEMAHGAYCKAAAELHGEFARFE